MGPASSVANLSRKLELGGYEVVAAAPSTGVNSLTGEGLEEALTRASVVDTAEKEIVIPDK